MTKPDESLQFQSVQADRTKTGQVLTNLFRNAVKFTDKGVIEFGFHSPEKDHLTFYVKDSGIGIPKDKQKYLFDFFRQIDDSDTRKFGGLGIGLAISKKISEILNGDLSCESAPGKGSVFRLTFPVIFSESAEASEENRKKKESMQNVKNTILVVEDDQHTLTLIKRTLEGAEVQIVEAQDGKEAVSRYKNNPHIDLVLMDLKLPVMDGFEATKKINKYAPIHL